MSNPNPNQNPQDFRHSMNMNMNMAANPHPNLHSHPHPHPGNGNGNPNNPNNPNSGMSMGMGMGRGPGPGPGPGPGSGSGSVAPLPSHSGGSHSSSSSTCSTHPHEDLMHQNQNQHQQHLQGQGLQGPGGKVIRPPTDISRLTHGDLVQRVRKLESDLIKLASDHNHMIREANHRIQTQGVEIAQMRTTMTRLEEDNAELRDLCCFLDDDRQKGRKLAREWQRFGRYTASVMRQEVAAYQSKLRDLDLKQHQLVADNQELKELCLYLDEERSQNFCSQCGAAVAFRRDDGDGSSSSTNATEDYNASQSQCDTLNNTASSTTSTGSGSSTQGNLSDREDFTRERNLSTQIVDYVKRLETRVNELEKQETVNCPESVLNALQVLQVCQGLEDNDIGDQEKALVRQMCNVVWKKLEDNPKL